MANYWAIAIGINHYHDHRIQPLTFAQRDAQLLKHFWAEDAQFPAHQCLLLADISPAVEPGVMIPTRANIQQAIAQLAHQNVRPQGVWWFFSGYGVQIDGKDYLLPIDADLSRLDQTAIAVETFFEQLSLNPAQSQFVALDIQRSSGIFTDQTIGTQTLELARHYGIPTFLSCAPNQHSYETISLRSGLFTAALLEAMRNGHCVTPEQLAHYLSTRLPELSEHLWRPRQDAIAVIPDSQKYALIVPGKVEITPYATLPIDDSFAANPFEFTGIDIDVPVTASSRVTEPGDARSTSANRRERTSAHERDRHPTEPTAGSTLREQEIPDSVFWRRLVLWGGLLAIALLGGVVLNNWSELTGTSDDVPPPPAPAPSESGASETSSIDNEPIDPLLQPANLDNPFLDNASTTTASALISNPPALAPTSTDSPPQSDQAIAASLTAASPAAVAGEAIAPPPPGTPSAVVTAIQTTLAARNYSGALQQLTQLPRDQRPSNYEALLRLAAQGTLLQARAAVSRVRAETATNQASDFNIAIQLARRLRPEHPYYNEAQRDIRTWSEVIYQLARGRASQPNQGSYDIAARNYSSAIAAASLVPPDQPEIYRAAQASISEWSQAIYTLAQSLSRSGDMAMAVQIAQRVPPNTAAYAVAQRLVTNGQAQY